MWHFQISYDRVKIRGPPTTTLSRSIRRLFCNSFPPVSLEEIPRFPSFDRRERREFARQQILMHVRGFYTSKRARSRGFVNEARVAFHRSDTTAFRSILAHCKCIESAVQTQLTRLPRRCSRGLPERSSDDHVEPSIANRFLLPCSSRVPSQC